MTLPTMDKIERALAELNLQDKSNIQDISPQLILHSRRLIWPSIIAYILSL